MSLREDINRRKGKWGRVKEFQSIERALIIDDDLKEKIMNEVPHQKVITPSSICDRYKVRMYVAKKIINQLVENGRIKFHAKTAYTEVYKPVET